MACNGLLKAIDVHGHFGSYDRGKGDLRDRLMSGNIDVVRHRAQSVGIRLTVVSALLTMMPDGGDVLRGNESARETAERHSDIRFWAVLNPKIRETYIQVDSMLNHPLCRGIKIHPKEHGYEISEFGEPIFQFASMHKTIVMTHSGCSGCNPKDFVPFADSYPEIPVILAHLGNSVDGKLDRQIEALKTANHENLFIDTSSAMSMTSGLIEWAVSEIGAKRLLFGTDTPLHFAACQKSRIEYAEIDDDCKNAILFDNAAKLLKEKNF